MTEGGNVEIAVTAVIQKVLKPCSRCFLRSSMAVQSVKKLHAMSFLIGPLGKVSLETGPNYLVE